MNKPSHTKHSPQTPLQAEVESHQRTKIKLSMLERELHAITTSRSYKLARGLFLFKVLISRFINKIKSFNPSRRIAVYRDTRHAVSVYDSDAFTKINGVIPTSELAVVIHLYYPEMLDYFENILKRLGDIEKDIFITIPIDKYDANVHKIKKSLPKSTVLAVPNRGRDVLPFVQVLKALSTLGYTKVLKVHSKKSPHRDDGDVWRDEMINNLIPADKKGIKGIISTLNKKNTALIGPAGEYVSLLVSFNATKHHTKKMLENIFGHTTAEDVINRVDEYGFFGGTMFWARVDALKDIVDLVGPRDFEIELGQQDSTLAHSLERLFSVVPEIRDQVNYSSSREGLTVTEHHTSVIPDWAEESL